MALKYAKLRGRIMGKYFGTDGFRGTIWYFVEFFWWIRCKYHDRIKKNAF